MTTNDDIPQEELGDETEVLDQADIQEEDFQDEPTETSSTPITRHELEEQREKTRVWNKIVKYTVGAIFLAALAATITGIFLVVEQVKYRDARIAYIQGALEREQDEKDEVSNLLLLIYERCDGAQDCDITNIPTPSGTGETQIESEAQKPVSMSDIAVAVSDYCRSGSCAMPVSQANVRAAIERYCVDGRCEGEQGEQGAEGPPGSVPTPEEISNAVFQYCSTGACIGPKGEQGTPGAPGTNGTDGTDGRGLQSLYCDDQGRWQVTYTDGATADAGECRVDAVEPTEPPEPTTPPDPTEPPVPSDPVPSGA